MPSRAQSHRQAYLTAATIIAIPVVSLQAAYITTKSVIKYMARHLRGVARKGCTMYPGGVIHSSCQCPF
eukprot:scaffold26678_cov41-Prasinocladus_malaysianus.AAC.1